MVDKGFNIEDHWASRCIELIIPLGKRGQSQMLPKTVKKTNSIAKMRILVEQVMRQLKILANEVPISVIPQLDDITVVCCALTNLRRKIYC